MPSSNAYAQGIAGVGTSGCIYNTIQDAILNAPLNGDVWVEASATPYSETLSVTQGVKVHAAEPGGTCDTPVGSALTVIVSSSSPLDVVTSGATVKFFDFTFKDSIGPNINAADTHLMLFDSFVLFGQTNGIRGQGGSLRLERSTVMLNEGSGVGWFDGQMWIKDSNITQNTAQLSGGGLSLGQVDLIVSGATTIHDNKALDIIAAHYGGGCIAAWDSSIQLQDDTIIEDCESEFGPGGAIMAEDSEVILRDDTIVRDSKTLYDGGLISLYGGELQMMHNVQLTGGYSKGGFGGLIYVTNGGQVSTTPGSSIELSGGRADFGGGIALVDDTDVAKVALGEGTLVFSNTAKYDGGGVYLDGGVYEQMGLGAWIGLDPFTPNTARNGGGIFATNGANFHIGDPLDASSWVELDGLGDPTGSAGAQVRFNVASENGGGIYASGWAIGRMEGAAVYNNKAVGVIGVGRGGGVYLADGGTSLIGNQSVVSRNRARVEGGGAYVDSAYFSLIVQQLGDGPSCTVGLLANTYCSEMRKNEAGRAADGTTGKGGALFVTGGPTDGVAFIDRTAVLENGAQVDGAHFFIETDGRVTGENNLIADAKVEAAWPAYQGVLNKGVYNSYNTTYGGKGTTINYVLPGGVFVLGGSGQFRRNIVWPDGTSGTGLSYPLFGNGSHPVGCNMGLLPSVAPVDPLFTTTSRGYYRLAPASPGIDGCSSGPLDDIDSCPRPGAGTVSEDVGALEFSGGACP